jgi:hypothetical protein
MVSKENPINLCMNVQILNIHKNQLPMCKSFTFGCMSIKNKILFIACDDPKMCSEINFDKLKTPSHTLATNLKKSTYKKNQVTNMEPYEKTIAFSKSPEHCLKNRNNEPQTEKI